MKAIDLIKSFIEKAVGLGFIKNEDELNNSLLLTYKQGIFLNSLLSKEDLIYSNVKGQYKKSGSSKSFILSEKHFQLITPAAWYGDKGKFILIFDKNFN